MVKQVDKKQQCCKLLKRELTVQLQICGTHKFTVDKNRGLAASVLPMAKDVFAFCESSTLNSTTGEIRSLSHSWNASHCLFLGCLKVDIYAGSAVKLPSFGLAINCIGLQQIHPGAPQRSTTPWAAEPSSRILLTSNAGCVWGGISSSTDTVSLTLNGSPVSLLWGSAQLWGRLHGPDSTCGSPPKRRRLPVQHSDGAQLTWPLNRRGLPWLLR